MAYCSNDVDLLRMLCLQYRKLFLDVTGIDPLREYPYKSVTLYESVQKEPPKRES